MDPMMLKREWPSLGLLGLYALEGSLAGAGRFATAEGLFLATAALGLAISLRLAMTDRSIWPTIMVASQLICVTCLLLGRTGDALVLAVWAAAHAPALIALAPGMVVRARAGRRPGQGSLTAPPAG